MVSIGGGTYCGLTEALGIWDSAALSGATVPRAGPPLPPLPAQGNEVHSKVFRRWVRLPGRPISSPLPRNRIPSRPTRTPPPTPRMYPTRTPPHQFTRDTHHTHHTHITHITHTSHTSHTHHTHITHTSHTSHTSHTLHTHTLHPGSSTLGPAVHALDRCRLTAL